MLEIRFKFTGTLFYIVVVTNLLLTTHTLNFLDHIAGNVLLKNMKVEESITQRENTLSSLQAQEQESAKIPGGMAPFVPIIAALLTLSALLFTSEAIGYAISSIPILWYEQVSFCDTDLSRLRQLMDRYGQEIKEHFPHLDFTESKNLNVIHNYLTQQKVPPTLIEWCVRRNTSFLTAISAYLGITLGLILSILSIYKLGWGWNFWNWVVSGISFFFIIIFRSNARRAFDEHWRMINLCYPNLLEALSRQEV